MYEFTIDSLRQAVRLGWYDEERAFPQVVTIDISLKVAAVRAFESDDVSDTVDYVQVVDLIRSQCEENSWKLLEKMTYDLVHGMLSAFPLVSEASISVKKNIVPLSQGISVRYTAGRGIE